MARSRRYTPLALTERLYLGNAGLPLRAQRAEVLGDIFTPRREEMQTPRRKGPGNGIVLPYSRKGRTVSGYRRQRFGVILMLGRRQGLTDTEIEEALHSRDPLQIAHIRPDEFSSYAARSGGTNYHRWMAHIRRHPENYKLLPKSQNWKEFVER